MADQVTELPWVGELENKENEKITLDILGFGVDWLKGDFRERWKSLLEQREILKERKGQGGKGEVLEVCTKLADLQRDLAYYLYLVSQNRQALEGLGKPIREALFGGDSSSVACCLGADRRSLVEGSLAGAISNLTFWHLISESAPSLADKLKFGQMVVGGINDSKFGIDVVLDFGTKVSGKSILRIVQLKTDRSGQVLVDRIYPDELKSGYLGNSITKGDAQRMIEGARVAYPNCDYRFFAVCVPSFDGPPIRNVFGIIPSSYQGRNNLIDDFKVQAFRTGLLPNLK